ncbi:oligosaccharide flippase family protein [Vibrio sp. JC009]|nr:oligosaccharide flippase family protein [Vibrio sp. JC009]
MVPFFLLPIMTSFLTQEEYGQVAIFQMAVSLFSIFIGLNSASYVVRKYYDNDTIDEIRYVNGASLLLLAISSVISILFVFYVSDVLSEILKVPASWLYYAVVISISYFIFQFMLGQIQARGNSKSYGLWQIGYGFFHFILAYNFIVFFGMGAEGRVEAWLVAIIFVSVLSLIYLISKRLVKIKNIKKSHIQEIVEYSTPLIPHMLGFILLGLIDRFIISRELGLSKVGVYMLAMQISMVIHLCFDAINRAYTPWLFNALNKNDVKLNHNIIKYTYYFYLLLVLSIVPMFFLSPKLVVLIGGSKYEESSYLINWICLGQIFHGMYLSVNNYVFYAKKTALLSIVTIGSGVINVILLLAVINWFYLPGVAIVFSISKFIQFLGTWWLASKVYPMPWLHSFKKV